MKKQKSLMLELSLVVVSVTTIILIIFIGYDYFLTSRTLRSQLDRSLSMTASRLAVGLSAPYYNYYTAGIRDILLAEMRQKEIIGIYIFELNDKKPQYGYSRSGGKVIMTEEVVSPPGSVQKSQQIIFGGDPLGEVRVIITAKYMNERLRKALISDIIKIAILDVFLIIPILLFLGKRFVRPIYQLTEASREIAEGDLDQVIEVRGGDEIGLLAQGFSRMRDSIKAQIVELKTEIEEREAAQDARRVSEERYTALFERSFDCIFVMNMEGNYIDANPATLNLLGYTKDEFLSMHMSGLVSEEYIPKARARFEEAKISPNPNELVEFRLRKKNGESVYIECRGSFIERDGQPYALHIVARDITQRKYAEEQVRKERDRAQLYLDIAGTIILAIDTEGTVTLINRKGCEVLGYPYEEIIGRNWFDSFVPSDTADEIRLVSEASLSGQADLLRYYENPIITKQGEERLIAWNNTVLRDSDGNVIGHLSSGEDITERKAAEEALRISEEKYRLMAENVSDVIYVLDLDLKFTFISPAVERLRGFTVTETITQGLEGVLTPDSLELARKILKEELGFEAEGTHDPKRSRKLELEMNRKDGTTIWTEVIVSFLRRRDGQAMGILGVTRDISERKQVEEEREQIYSQLQQAQKMEAIGTLAGGIAHDFNNILSAIIGYTQLAQYQIADDSPILDYIDQVLKASNRAKDLVKHILAFSRQSEQEMVPVQIGSIIKEALKLLRASIPTTIEIRQDIKSDLSAVMADQTQIHQVIMNLAANAAHAMEENGGVLEVTLTEAKLGASTAESLGLKPGLHLKLTVTDTGHGMDRATMDRIFDPYFTTKQVGAGTGMGLAVVHGIVASHGGAISVDSQPGEGTSFQIYLPVIESKADQTAQDLEPLPRGNERILFVDDEVFLVDIWKKMLEGLGYKVETRASSIEALEAFRANPDRFDLIITDMTMPQMTGETLAKEIIKIRPDMPVVLCTGFSSKITPESAEAIGIKGYLLKPLTRRDMATTIRQVLDQGRMRG